MTKITDHTAPDLKTDNVVDCGVVCSKLETCSGLVYEKESKACTRMKKVERREPCYEN